MSATERVEHTLRCPRDGRTVARVVVRDGTRFLETVGGRSGHLREITEFIGERTNQPAREVILSEHRYDNTIRPSSIALDERMREFCDYLGGSSRERAVCPKCNTVYTLAVAFAFEKWNVVLRS